jgi:hypothetical protein
MVVGSMDDFTYLAIEAISMLQYDVSMLQVRLQFLNTLETYLIGAVRQSQNLQGFRGQGTVNYQKVRGDGRFQRCGYLKVETRGCRS